MKKYLKILILILLIFILFFIGNKNNYFTKSKLKNLSLKSISIIDKYIDLKNYKKYKLENEKLTNGLTNNEIITNQNKELEEEINTLKEELNLKKIYTSYDIIYSTVINRDDITNTFIIDKGKNDNIEKGSPVVNTSGLIGIIDILYDDNSVVKLINNNNLNLSIKINNNYGSLSYYKDNIYKVSDISNYNDIKVNDKVYTTGMGNLPSGIFIGIVKEIQKDNYGISNIFYIEGFNSCDAKYIAVLRSK